MADLDFFELILSSANLASLNFDYELQLASPYPPTYPKCPFFNQPCLNLSDLESCPFVWSDLTLTCLDVSSLAISERPPAAFAFNLVWVASLHLLRSTCTCLHIELDALLYTA